MLNRFRLPRKWVIVLRFVLPLHAVIFFFGSYLISMELLLASEADGYQKSWQDYFYFLYFRPGVHEIGVMLAPFVAYRHIAIRVLIAGAMIGSIVSIATVTPIDFALAYLGAVLGIQGLIENLYFGLISLWRIMVYAIAFLCLIPKTELR